MADKTNKGKIKDSFLIRLNDGDDEILRYQQILIRDPSSLVFAALAEAFRKRKMVDQAIGACKKGLRYHPNFISGRVALAGAYLDSGQTEQARNELEKIVQKAPDNLVAQRLLAGIYEQKADYDNLEKTAHRILSLDTNDLEAQRMIRLQAAQEAKEGSQDQGKGKKTEIVTRTLADIYAGQGYHEKAYEIYKSLSLQEPQNRLFHERLADLKEKIVHRSSKARVRGEAKEALS